ncbi:hypothetical protein AVV36_gp219 [Pectobacterium bacteriophage PM2]|uniref:Phage protein n=1 Tax=Pectobacterium bacteriophage PM2 TaxID=1429794 RepID=A0A0A0Q0N2_9CAUD|nr:hypothetical protein AVV36_gp219 [Pectobacterium bacteriophage PM2]AHY25191.1 hypothetical protein PM2_229 [Pectobacterium bacteriophage PM2]
MIINLNEMKQTRGYDGSNFVVCDRKQWRLSKHQGDLVYCDTPEGRSDDFEWIILLSNSFTGEEYILNTTVKGRIEYYEHGEDSGSFYLNGRSRADHLIEQMTKTGEINLSNWTRINEF